MNIIHWKLKEKEKNYINIDLIRIIFKSGELIETVL